MSRFLIVAFLCCAVLIPCLSSAQTVEGWYNCQIISIEKRDDFDNFNVYLTDLRGSFSNKKFNLLNPQDEGTINKFEQILLAALTSNKILRIFIDAGNWDKIQHYRILNRNDGLN
jgi:hypothetical protein